MDTMERHVNVLKPVKNVSIAQGNAKHARMVSMVTNVTRNVTSVANVSKNLVSVMGCVIQDTMVTHVTSPAGHFV